MTNVIRLTQKEIDYVNEIKRLLEQKEKVKAETWPLMGLGVYRSYIDYDDFHSIFNEMIWYAELQLKSEIENSINTLEIIKKEKKES